MSYFDDLLGKSNFVLGDFVEAFKVALDGVLRVANLASSTTNKIIRSISMANKACAHHEGSKMANVQGICTWIGTPIAKEIINKTKRQPMDWEKIFVNDVTDRV